MATNLTMDSRPDVARLLIPDDEMKELLLIF